MNPILYDKTGSIMLGQLKDCIECFVEEERNGIFELRLIYPITDDLFNLLDDDNIIVADANDILENQKFRIYNTRKLMENKVEVYAKHISFDLVYDYVQDININNQSCEYALNAIFRNSQFSTHYKGYSDIVNTQNFNVNMKNCLKSIAGSEGSIIDTYGTGAEILRDNTNIYVLNSRGNDNEVTIEYRKNLTGFELDENKTDLETRCAGYFKYIEDETNEEVIIMSDWIDSDNINNFSHPYINPDGPRDYSDKFDEGVIPTKEQLNELCQKEFTQNKRHIPKTNYKIEFIPLSKCVGYEGLGDRISLCDTVTIKDSRYNINTKAKVIRTVFDALRDRYESMELGEPRTTLGDIIHGSGKDGEQGPPGPQGPPGADGDIGDFPDSLPQTPVLNSKLYGFSTIELSWTFENKPYYTYELYASKTKDFNPNTFDIIHAGQSSSFLFQTKPNETWYFKVCCVNSHGNRTSFSSQVTVTTTKISDLSNYVDNMAINDTLIGELKADRAWIGKFSGNDIDARNITVTDGNGKITFKVDTNGNVELLGKIKAESGEISSDMIVEELNVEGNVSSDKVTTREVNCPDVAKIVTSDVVVKVDSTGNDLIKFENGAIFSTLQGCIESIPRNLNGNTVTINVTSILNENITIKGFNSGTLIINFKVDIQGTIKGLDCSAKIFLNGVGENKSTLKYNYILTDWLNFREGRGSSYTLLATIPGDTRLLVTDISDGWGKTTYNGQEGYISMTQGRTQEEEVYEITIENATNIKPATLLSEIGRKYSIFFDNCNYVEINHINIYGKTGSGSFAVGGYRSSNVRVENVNVIGSENAFDSVDMSKMFVKNTLGKVNSMAYYSNSASIINIANGLSVNGTFIKQDDSQIIYNSEKVVLDTSSEVGSNDNTTVANETITLKSSSANTYKHNVYKGWTNDNTAKQGDYGYGDCDGYWFFGTQFEKLKGKTIKKITLKIIRQKGGIYASHSHILRAHTYTSKPSIAPTMHGSWSQSFNVAVGETVAVTITDSTLLNAISNGTVKGFGVKDTYDKTHYSVLSADVTLTVITG